MTERTFPADIYLALAGRIVTWRKSKGFYTPKQIGESERNRDLMLGKLMLVATELTELEQARTVENVKEEFADIGIRVLDITGTYYLDGLAEHGGEASFLRILTHVASLVDDEEIARSFEPIPSDRISSAAMEHAIVYMLRQVSLAAEAVRHEDDLEFIKKLLTLLGFIWEQADAWSVCLADEIKTKMDVNDTRPTKHGKRCSL